MILRDLFNLFLRDGNLSNNMTARAETAGAVPRPRWKSGNDQPAYARPALAAVVVLAAVLFAWGINRADYHSFYANSARSMTESWKAFFFGSFDAGNTMAVDKIPGFLWPQAVSALIFGFHPWSLILPQVIEGVMSVLVLYQVVRRWAGVNAALLASAAMLATPVVVGLFRTTVEDPMYTLCVLLAVDATQRAAERGRMRLLMLAAVWVGVGCRSRDPPRVDQLQVPPRFRRSPNHDARPADGTRGDTDHARSLGRASLQPVVPLHDGRRGGPVGRGQRRSRIPRHLGCAQR